MNQIKQNTNIIGKFFTFIKDTWLDKRIPTRDRWVISICLFLIVSPLDIIPDVIPVIGIIDDLILLSFILDYFFNRLDNNIILDHFPFNNNKFYNIKSIVGRICKISPQHALHFLWKYKKSKNNHSTGIKNVN